MPTDFGKCLLSFHWDSETPFKKRHCTPKELNDSYIQHHYADYIHGPSIEQGSHPPQVRIQSKELKREEFNNREDGLIKKL